MIHIPIPEYEWIQSLVTIIVAVIASGGFWSFLNSRFNRHDATTRLILGLAHNEIVIQGLSYIERGYITKDEYEDYIKYLYAPYSTFGGNGLAERIFKEVGNLPIRKTATRDEEIAIRRSTARKEDPNELV